MKENQQKDHKLKIETERRLKTKKQADELHKDPSYKLQSQSYDSKEDPQQNLKKLKKKLKKKKNKNVGFWSDDEKQVFIQFLLKNYDDFESNSVRRTYKVFYRMAMKIKIRTAEQCRTHHQKLRLKYGNTKNIIEGVRKQLKQKQQQSISISVKIQQHSEKNQNDLYVKKQDNNEHIKFRTEQDIDEEHLTLGRNYISETRQNQNIVDRKHMNIQSSKDMRQLQRMRRGRTHLQQNEVQSDNVIQIELNHDKKLIFVELNEPPQTKNKLKVYKSQTRETD